MTATKTLLNNNDEKSVPIPGEGDGVHKYKFKKILKGLIKGILTWVYILMACAPFTSVYRELFKRLPKIKEFPDKSGEVAVLTGGTRGIGFEVLKQLLQCNYHIFIGCRSVDAGIAAIKSIRDSGITGGSAKVFTLNLKSLKSVQTFAENILKETPRIDVLINNAGTMMVDHELTENGYESQFQVNYLSHFKLTYLLLPRIKETGVLLRTSNCRIINVASVANFGGFIDFKELETCDTYYNASRSYANSKLCQVLHASHLHKLLDMENAKINVYSLHPGIIPSDLWKSVGEFVYSFFKSIKFLFKNTSNGADCVLYAVLSSNLELKSGAYIDTGDVCKSNPAVQDEFLKEQLWKRSLQLADL